MRHERNPDQVTFLPSFLLYFRIFPKFALLAVELVCTTPDSQEFLYNGRCDLFTSDQRALDTHNTSPSQKLLRSKELGNFPHVFNSGGLVKTLGMIVQEIIKNYFMHIRSYQIMLDHPSSPIGPYERQFSPVNMYIYANHSLATLKIYPASKFFLNTCWCYQNSRWQAYILM